jgi:hypothetical protein
VVVAVEVKLAVELVVIEQQAMVHLHYKEQH